MISGVPIPILRTKRLTLRPLRLDDAPTIQQVFPHFELMKHLAAVIPWPYPDNGAEEFVQMKVPEIESGETYVWAMTLADANDDRLIGLIELVPTGHHNRGFWLGLDHHGKGYMSEAVHAVNDFAFDVLGMEKMRLGNAEPNIGSNRLKEKSGATILEIKPEESFVGGTFPSVEWELTREAWHANRDSFL